MLECDKVKNEKYSEKAECNLEGDYSPVWKIKKGEWINILSKTARESLKSSLRIISVLLVAPSVASENQGIKWPEMNLRRII